MKSSLILSVILVSLAFFSGCKSELVDYNHNDSDGIASADNDGASSDDSQSPADADKTVTDNDLTPVVDEDIKKAECGNGIPEEGETCEKDETKECTAISNNYVGGTAECKTDCLGFDVSKCEKKQDVSEFCGDAVKNGTELCDNEAKLCTEIDSAQFVGGNASCKATCDGWDTAGCEKKPVILDEPTGIINTVAIQTTYIFDAERMSETSYISSKKSYFQKSPAAFSGTINGIAFPYTAESYEPWTGSMYDISEKSLKILMGSAKISGLTLLTKDISLELFLKSESLTTKEYAADWTTNDADEAKIVVFKGTEAPLCVLAVAAKGSIDIEEVPAADLLDIDVLENITITATSINLYSPKNMPYAQKDISALITSYGFTVCP